MQNNTFSTLFVGQNLIKLSEVDSTNNFLKMLVSKSEPLTEGTVIMADHQFAGRGQVQNIWHAAAGMNLTFSILLKPVFLAIHKQFLLNMAISIGIRNGLRYFVDRGISVKWPNDLYFEQQKTGGVLIENIISGSSYKAAVVGIGINVNQVSFEPGLQGSVTSLKEILGSEVGLMELLPHICAEIETQYVRLKAGEEEALKQDYLQGLYQFGEEARYRQSGEEIRGTIVDVSSSGMLVMLTDGERKSYNFKEITFLK
ncbi:putative biotin--(acetyl-CoA carboxylase) synthetase [Pedobacter sp. BAL39]|uniref:biotin--[acetyl-CoA-carboxylase] ligase n=1 Tax=Pedobacter sp. BAL39 TaxID=391596 RepID=UPI0001559919|nr:biotin--[acetyl-CoA-carboxylase] ligase [Pedobacter sp. BAL39]EDM36317.1 putative biotin--(acetyl-CoA carboxylase) synthetase [Pedobacter sp. BAL39]